MRRTVRSDLSRMVCLQEARFFISDLHCSSIGSDGCGGESWLRFTIATGRRRYVTAGEDVKKGLGFRLSFFLSSCLHFVTLIFLKK